MSIHLSYPSIHPRQISRGCTHCYQATADAIDFSHGQDLGHSTVCLLNDASLTIPPRYAIHLFLGPNRGGFSCRCAYRIPFSACCRTGPGQYLFSFRFSTPAIFCQLPCAQMRSNYRKLGKSDIKMTVTFPTPHCRSSDLLH